jgi:hypothetical protein
MTTRFRTAGLATMCIVAAAAFGTSGAGAKKPSCKTKHEAKNCAVAKKFVYSYALLNKKTSLNLQVAYKKTSAFTVTLGGNAYLPCKTGSVAPKSYSLGGGIVTIKKKPVVGKTYTGSLIDSGTRLTAKFKVKVKFTSATRASVTFTYSETLPGQGSTLACSTGKTVTLKRTA